MPRFSIKDLLIAITLVAVGLSALAVLFNALRMDLLIAMLTFYGGFAAIGAGLLAPFHRKKLGAAIGVCLATFFTLVNFVMLIR